MFLKDGTSHPGSRGYNARVTVLLLATSVLNTFNSSPALKLIALNSAC